MIKLVKYYLEHNHEKGSKNKRPLKFRKNFKFEEFPTAIKSHQM